MFFEGVLIPMYLIIGVWGGPRRVYAAVKFFLFTLTGSVLMLLALIAMWLQAGTTDIPTLLHTHFPATMQTWLFLALFASFAVKVPMWPVHTWLPDAHVEAPTAGLGHPGRRAVEDGRLRVPALLGADAAGGLGELRAADLHAVGRRGDLHLARRAGAGGHEEADRLFLGRAHGRRDDRHLHLQRAGHLRARCSRCCRTASFRPRCSSSSAWSTTVSTRGRSPATAASADRMPGYALVFMLFIMATIGLPGTVGLHRRVPGHHRRDAGEFLAGAAGRHGHDPGRGLHAVPVSPGDLRPHHHATICATSWTSARVNGRCSRRWSC